MREQWGHLEQGEETQDVVGVAGRVVFIRNTGKLASPPCRRASGTRLQVMLSLAEVGEESLAAWKADVDLGDHVFVEGRVISSRRGELSVHGEPLGDGVARRCARCRSCTRSCPRRPGSGSATPTSSCARRPATWCAPRPPSLRAIRETLDDQGYLEVETPVLQLVHGGAAARPFRTHLNAFDQDMTLRIALELNLKKAVVGGVDRVYEMGRIFRNEGVDATHSRRVHDARGLPGLGRPDHDRRR